MKIHKPTDLFDLENLAQHKPFHCFMASSYDREGGNYDWGNYRMVRGTDATVFDVDGPGMIVRMWSANPQGKIRIFLDGGSDPVVNEDFENLLRRLPMSIGHGHLRRGSPEFEAIVEAREPLGLTSYCIIPFNEGCRVVLSPIPDIYYQFNYLLWNESHKLPSFSPSMLKDNSKEYGRIKDSFCWSSAPSDTLCTSGSISLKAGEKATVFDMDGSFVIQEMSYTVPCFEDEMQKHHVLEKLLLRAYWDEDLTVKGSDIPRRKPSIKSPLAYFFMDYGLSGDYNTALISKNGTTYTARFPMPVNKHGVIEIVNTSCFDLNGIKFQIRYQKTKDNADLHRFKAIYHLEDSTFGPDLGNYRDDVMYMRNLDDTLNYPLLRIWGDGHFVGCSFHVDNTETPYPRALGESDEAVFVDDNPDLTMWGTGNEDYVNDAWGFHPVRGALSGGEHFEDSFFGYRFHVSDPIPFQKKLAFTLEHGSSNNCTAVYKSVAYFYLREEGKNVFVNGVPPRRMNRYFSM